MKFRLRCLKCNKTYSEDEYVCKCANNCDSILRTEYTKKKLELVDKNNGIWKYINWLPIKTVERNLIENTSSFYIFRSKKLAEYLGLKNLIICMNVFPNMHTGSFKDIEAEVTMQRVIDSKENGKPLVLSSDGNNAISFIYYSYISKYPIVLFVTEDAKNKRIWSYNEKNPFTHLFSLRGDYYDAIKLSQQFGQIDGFLPEGGALNVARRDGVGTIFLESVRFLGSIPDHYFQALGSGPGAIAVYESALRLIEDGDYGDELPKIHGSQNYPYVPMYDAWTKKTKEIDKKYQIESAKKLIDQTQAHVLTNRYPAYSIKGGVYDVLIATSGEFYSVTNQELSKAQALFKKLEGVSIVPESGVTVSSLIKSKEQELINADDNILINITGGGREEMQIERFKIDSNMLSGSYSLQEIAKGILK